MAHIMEDRHSENEEKLSGRKKPNLDFAVKKSRIRRRVVMTENPLSPKETPN